MTEMWLLGKNKMSRRYEVGGVVMKDNVRNSMIKNIYLIESIM